MKQQDNVGREVLDKFETAVERERKTRGYVVAFSFTRGAREEAARVKLEKGMEIRLVRIEDILAGRVEVAAPPQGMLMAEPVLTPPRPADALPSVEELIASEHDGKVA